MYRVSRSPGPIDELSSVLGDYHSRLTLRTLVVDLVDFSSELARNFVGSMEICSEATFIAARDERRITKQIGTVVLVLWLCVSGLRHDLCSS